MNKIIFTTYATHNERLFDILVESSKRNNINLNILGYGEKWEGWKKRAEQILIFLNKYDDNQLICNIDGFDSIILGSELELYEKFNKYYKNKKIVFSSFNPSNIIVRYYTIKKFNLCRDNFLSAGLFIGYNYYIKKILTEFIKSDYSDDQKFFTSLCNLNEDIGIDNNILFYNFQYEIFKDNYKFQNNRLIINNNNPVIISAPGNVNIVNLLKNFGYKDNKFKNINCLCYIVKNTKDDYKYFWKEIIFVLLLLIIIIYKLIKQWF
jgi:hypothetical protein